MKRLNWLLVALALVGCRSQAQPSDPFLRTTVPPPTTGQGAPGGSQPYYSPSGSNSSGGSSAPTGNKYTPPGGSFNYQQTSTDAVDPGLASTAGKHSADALGEQLAATVNALDDPAPTFTGPTTPPKRDPVQLAVHSEAAVTDFSDPPPLPQTISGATARTAAREIVETGHRQQPPAGDAGQNVIRIVGTEIITEPRSSTTEQPSAVAPSVQSADISQQPVELATLPSGLKWRRKGLSGQSYEQPPQVGMSSP